MKTYSLICKKIILFIFAVLILSNCEKNEDTKFLLQNEWKIKSVSTEKKTLNAPSKNFREEVYILKFTDDSCFLLATSVNYAGGGYIIISEGNISINYSIFTKVCCENDFDEQMINVMNRVNSYYFKGNRLIFSADKNEKIIFEKR